MGTTISRDGYPWWGDVYKADGLDSCILSLSLTWISFKFIIIRVFFNIRIYYHISVTCYLLWCLVKEELYLLSDFKKYVYKCCLVIKQHDYISSYTQGQIYLVKMWGDRIMAINYRAPTKLIEWPQLNNLFKTWNAFTIKFHYKFVACYKFRIKYWSKISIFMFSTNWGRAPHSWSEPIFISIGSHMSAWL